MSSADTLAPDDGPALSDAEAHALAVAARTGWWLYLIAGILWCTAAMVILQFDSASVNTVGIIIGVMFLAAGAQQVLLASVASGARWLFWLMGGVFTICGIVSLFNPADTVAGLADTLGFLFLIVGLWWTLEPFALRSSGRPLWWFGFITGPLMLLTAFWTSGQFFFDKVYVLLVFAGVMALAHGLGDIFKAFALRAIGRAVA